MRLRVSLFVSSCLQRILHNDKLYVEKACRDISYLAQDCPFVVQRIRFSGWQNALSGGGSLIPRYAPQTFYLFPHFGKLFPQWPVVRFEPIGDEGLKGRAS